ncbi:hypothetical protein B0H66DRAFT_320808 [Apodospora peruviana]|uniref:Fungal specific transcription factor n=1 Tax=Apodospora peruviana TaxID=516989 RepID=A0AAE0HZE6_9PEZI|nr:hypothetical protein B0H66DRAFT_320808 [Apodospora peruviana]
MGPSSPAQSSHADAAAASTSLCPGSSPSAQAQHAATAASAEVEEEPVTTTTTTDSSTGTGGYHKEIPLLPAPDHSKDPDEPEEGRVTTIQVNGAAVVLDKLGPMIVARDGTVSRIGNWGEMTDRERENTLRVLGKRNQLRLADLRGGGGQQPQQGQQQG